MSILEHMHVSEGPQRFGELYLLILKNTNRKGATA